MTRLRVFLLAVVASVAVASGAGRAQGQAQGQAPPQGPTFKTGTQLVPVYVTVTDPERHLVADLIKDDFDVLDNGKPVPIVLFDAEVQPISVVTMLDTSGSMTGSLDLLKAAAEQFLIRLLPHDRGMVGAFNDKIQFVSPLTSDRDDLVSSLQDIGFGNPTRLYDAIDASLEQLKPIEGRRVVLIFTDGDDTFSKIGSGTVLDRARTDEVMIYSIGLQSVYFNGQRQVRTQPDRILKKLSDETGGGYFELKRTDDLGPTFTRVAQELHSQYSLAFAPAADGKVHKLEVVVKRPGMTARARRSYQAPGAKATQ
jgi:Ca-activated chloride channel homolog